MYDLQDDVFCSGGILLVLSSFARRVSARPAARTAATLYESGLDLLILFSGVVDLWIQFFKKPVSGYKIPFTRDREIAKSEPPS